MDRVFDVAYQLTADNLSLAWLDQSGDVLYRLAVMHAAKREAIYALVLDALGPDTPQGQRFANSYRAAFERSEEG